MKNSLALVITEEDKKYIRGIYKSTINETTYTPPPELDTVDKIKAFQEYMNSEDPTWYKGGVLPAANMGQYGSATEGAWGSHKDAYLIRINANTNTNSGGIQKVEDGWYYVDSNGAQQGPVKLSDLSGKITNDTYLFNGKLTSNWAKAGDAGMRAQVGNLIGPPAFKKPEDKKSEADDLLTSTQNISKFDYKQNAVIVTDKTGNTTTTTTKQP
jgi:hypothetical protein